jgi:hypothetical protein
VEIPLSDAKKQAESIAINIEQESGTKFLKQKYAVDHIRNVSFYPEFFGWKHIILLLPIYRATYSYEDKKHLIYLSGVTGALQAIQPKVIFNYSLFYSSHYFFLISLFFFRDVMLMLLLECVKLLLPKLFVFLNPQLIINTY